jgi:hypothetical protein
MMTTIYEVDGMDDDSFGLGKWKEALSIRHCDSHQEHQSPHLRLDELSHSRHRIGRAQGCTDFDMTSLVAVFCIVPRP